MSWGDERTELWVVLAFTKWISKALVGRHTWFNEMAHSSSENGGGGKTIKTFFKESSNLSFRESTPIRR
jgi:hypothetical protein